MADCSITGSSMRAPRARNAAERRLWVLAQSSGASARGTSFSAALKVETESAMPEMSSAASPSDSSSSALAIVWRQASEVMGGSGLQPGLSASCSRIGARSHEFACRSEVVGGRDKRDHDDGAAPWRGGLWPWRGGHGRSEGKIYGSLRLCAHLREDFLGDQQRLADQRGADVAEQVQ